MQVATLLVFKEGIDPERIRKWVEKLQELEVLETYSQSDFDVEDSFPILYFP
jgi:hypothetical protein